MKYAAISVGIGGIISTLTNQDITLLSAAVDFIVGVAISRGFTKMRYQNYGFSKK